MWQGLPRRSSPQPHLSFSHISQHKLPGDGLPHGWQVQIRAKQVPPRSTQAAGAALRIRLWQRLQALESPGAVHRCRIVSPVLVRGCGVGHWVSKRVRDVTGQKVSKMRQSADQGVETGGDEAAHVKWGLAACASAP